MIGFVAQKGMPTERLDPVDLLAALCGFLDEELDVFVHQPGWEFCTGFRGHLARVRSLPPESGAVTLDFEGGESLTLVPSEVIAFSGPSLCHQRGGWMELQLGFGGVVTIESLPAQHSGPTQPSAP